MVFGFNTDIKYQDVVFHVQSEVRQAEHSLQSQIFVRGRCVGQHATSIAERASQPEFSEDEAHEMLKAQHRNVVDAIRAGKLEALLGKTIDLPRPGSAPASVTPASGGAAAPAAQSDAVAPAGYLTVKAPAGPATATLLKLEAITAETLASQGAMRFRFRVLADNTAASGAQLTARLDLPGQAPIYTEMETAADGTAELRLPLERASKPEAVLLVQASYGGKSITQKFRLRKA